MRLPKITSVSVVACLLVMLAVPSARAAAPTIRHGVAEGEGGTPIAYSLFLPEGASATSPVPVVFYTHGWGGSRTRSVGGLVETLLGEGYAVLTWDARGFGDSGGEVNVDSQELETRDVRALIDLAAAEDAIQLDAPGDPRMGMTGVSYAGGIQLMTASADPRVDAIIPEIAWNDLPQSLRPNGVLKLGWGTLLYSAGTGTATGDGIDARQTGSLAPEIHRAYAESTTLNDWSDETLAWFAARSTGRYIPGGSFEGLGTLGGVRVPTLVIQGANDTLFPLNEGLATLEQVRANGAPVKLIVFCGGHTMNPTGTSCATDFAEGPTQASVIRGEMLAWLDAHVREPLGDANTGPAVEYQLQDGTFRALPRLPQRRSAGEGEGTLVHTIAPTSGAGTAGTPSPYGLRIPLEVPAGATILGLPRARLSVSGVGTEATLFVKLLDRSPDGTLTVVDDQVMPFRVRNLSAEPQKVDFDLGGVSWKVEKGHSILAEITTSSNDYSASRVPSTVNVQASIALPLVTVPATARRATADGAAGNDARNARVLGSTLPRTGVGSGIVVAVLLLALAIGLTGWLERGRRAENGYPRFPARL